ncbi:MAG: methionine synthase [Chthonomonadales bacterium]|nr:methionine synthase [Chthonomonadales bacterium]
MHELIQALLKQAPVITDGAWGTQLQARGLPVGVPPDPWNLERPEQVAEVARGYVEAGSRIILTNTFGANRVLLERHGLAARVAAINSAGARLSVEAAAGSARVFASVGPTGKMVAMGEIDADELRACFAEQVEALAAGGVDGFVIETMSDVEEAVAAVSAAAATGLPVVASMSYGSGKSGDRTIMGITPEQAAEALLAAGADIVGANCGQGPDTMVPIVERLRAASGRPVWAKPNAGLPRIVDGAAVYDQTPQVFAEGARALVDAGAGFIGGCCGTGPAFIRALVSMRS